MKKAKIKKSSLRKQFVYDIPSESEMTRFEDPKFRFGIVQSVYKKSGEQAKKMYNDNREAVARMIHDRIWYVLGTPQCPDLEEIAKIYKINLRTLQGYRGHLKRDPYWVPHPGNAERQKIFTPEEEKYLVKTIKDYAALGIPISYNLVRLICLAYYQQLYDRSELNNAKVYFNCSNKFIGDFLAEHNLTHRRAHSKRRPETDPAEIQRYRAYLEDIASKYEHDHILNADETFWRCADRGLYTWASKGSDNVHIYTPSNDKEGFTALATINLQGDKLPLLLIGKGTTTRCEKSQYGFSNPISNSYTEGAIYEELHFTDNSPSGWVTAAIWSRYLHFIRAQVPYIQGIDQNDPRNKIFLVCDSYAVHHSQMARDEAATLHIELVQVPKGTTDECQPLDRRIFGALKARGRAELNHHINAAILLNFTEGITPTLPYYTKQDAARTLMKIWDAMPASQIINSWQIAIYGNEEGQDV